MRRSSKGSKERCKRKRVDDANGTATGTSGTAKLEAKEGDHALVLPLNVVPVKAEADAVHPPAKRRRVQDHTEVRTVRSRDQQPNVQLQSRPTLRSLVLDMLAILDDVRKTVVKTAQLLDEAQEAEENDAELLREEAADAHAEATVQFNEAASMWTTVVATAVQNGRDICDLRMALVSAAILLGTLAMHYYVGALLDEAETDMSEEIATIEEAFSQLPLPGHGSAILHSG
ncbi:hypothetical protein EV401DRAFT_2064930 [Pisolithus croceorrhizus]|nr:hypothetical protein EV401DRAFT_2064930 [Pisolithus croceorrhizus]